MPYRIAYFDGLALPEYKIEGQDDDLGTGRAEPSLVQLPGGGFYDVHGARTAPSSLQAVIRNCVVWGDTQAELKSNLDALRAKRGVRGRLVVIFDDGTKRWQWARLVEISAPRPLNAVGHFLPVRLMWQPLEQFWYGLIQGEWTWGDGSWTFGDGAVLFGEDAETFNLTSSTVTGTVTHSGNVDAKNIWFSIAPSTDSYTLFAIWNLTNGSRISYSGAMTNTYDRVIIDCGAKSCRSISSTTVSISSIKGWGNQLVVVTSSAHGLAAGDVVEIDGTTNYDGEYEVWGITNSTQFYCYNFNFETGATETSGTMAEVTGRLSNLLTYDDNDWFYLSPGANSLQISITGSTIANGVMTLVYTDHYA